MNTSSSPLTSLFNEIIPARAMGISVASFDGGSIQLRAPLEKNINDKGTGFAGSIASMLSLAGWGVITAALQERGWRAEVMIVKSELDYCAAVRGDLEAEASIAPEELLRIGEELGERGRSRAVIHSELRSGGGVCATATAQYALILNDRKKED